MGRRLALALACAVALAAAVSGCSEAGRTQAAQHPDRDTTTTAPAVMSTGELTASGFVFGGADTTAASLDGRVVLTNSSRAGRLYYRPADGNPMSDDTVSSEDGIPAVVEGDDGDWQPLADPPPVGARVVFNVGESVVLVGASCRTEDRWCEGQPIAARLDSAAARWERIDMPGGFTDRDDQLQLVGSTSEGVVVRASGATLLFGADGTVQRLEVDSGGVTWTCATEGHVVAMTSNDVERLDLTRPGQDPVSGAGAPVDSVWTVRACTSRGAVLLRDGVEHLYSPSTNTWTSTPVALPWQLTKSPVRLSSAAVTAGGADYFIADGGYVIERTASGVWNDLGTQAAALVPIDHQLTAVSSAGPTITTLR